ncbi:MAG: type II toxin-antitoxin system VapC family toxin [Blastocatellia bacterium]
MTYLLDTNVCIRLLNNSSPKAAQRLASVNPLEVFICSIVKAELFYGAYKSQKKATNLTNVNAFCSQFISLPFDDPASEISGRERARLATLGTPIGLHDLLIAAIALANQATLVTHNTREFGRVAGLQIEDWEI